MRRTDCRIPGTRQSVQDLKTKNKTGIPQTCPFLLLMSTSIKNQRALFVLGMHRSGTSALARILNLMGVDLGIDSEAGGKDNQRGFWENPDLVTINEDVLKSMHSSWEDPRSLPDQWWQSDSVAPLVQKIENVLDQQFSHSSFWGLKDPRVCRLLPLWLNLLDKRNCEATFICITRHPMEVMRSLKTRNQFSSWKGYLLWLKYILDAEQGSRGRPRVFVTYEDLLSDSVATIEHISKTASLPLPEDRDALFQKAGEFLSSDLRHERADRNSLSKADPLHQLIDQAYQALLKAGGPDENGLSGVLDRVRQEWDDIEPEILPLIEENEALVVEAVNQERSKRLSKRLSRNIKKIFGPAG